MKKHLLKTVICFTLTLVMSFAFVGCVNGGPSINGTMYYTVTFDVQGHGTAPKKQVVEKDGYATEPSAPSANGYVFRGWFKESACENEFTFSSQKITADTTVYAKWSVADSQITTYTVTFDVGDHGVAPNKQLVDQNGYAVRPSAPSETGWTFDGWYADANFIEEFDFSSVITANTTVYAKWTQFQIINDATPTVYLAGDSTVQTYAEGQYIAGWGQYLSYFLDEDVKVVNAARGGRSARSFINEGRLYNFGSYTFSENGGKSLQDSIKPGDYLFIQFGHNDDDSKKTSSYSTLADRMTPLGTANSSGVYPVTAPTNGAEGRSDGRNLTSYVPDEYSNNIDTTSESAMLTELAKYGDYYYAYDCGGTYKWFLKQYIDYAREWGAIPVLVTPVARVNFNSDGTLKSGAGLHGENFAYVEAVRQLANEEDCLLIDLFADTKEIVETATKEYASFLMAIVPNSVTGTWPTDYDSMYVNKSNGYEKMEATHYNKYGAYLTAAMLVEDILNSIEKSEVKGENNTEYFNFTARVNTTPSSYIDPSNLISKTKVALIEALFEKVNPTNPDRTYPSADQVIQQIQQLVAVSVTAENYAERQTAYDVVMSDYNNLNVDDRVSVDLSSLKVYGAQILNAKIAATLTGTASEAVTASNYKTYETLCKSLRAEIAALNDATLEQTVTNVTIISTFENAIKAVKPKPTKTVVLSAGGVDTDTVTSSVTVDGITFSFNTCELSTSYKATEFDYNDATYGATSQCIYLKGNANLTKTSASKYIEFTTDKAFTITVVAGSSGDDRTIQMVDGNRTQVATFAAVKTPQAITTFEEVEAGTYRLGSTSGNVCVYYVIIEFYS